MVKLFILSILSFILLSCYSIGKQQAKFEEPKREKCYQKCLGSYKGGAEGAYKRCFSIASKYQEGHSCFGGHG